MRVHVTKTRKGSPDGIEVREYQAGESYEMPDSLGAVFLREGWAEADKSLPGPEETKPLKGPKEKKRGKGKVEAKDESIFDEGHEG